MFILTEILSFLKCMEYAYLIAGWLLFDLLLAFVCYKRRDKISRIISRKIFQGFKLYYVISIFIALLSIYFAVKTVPYNFDSMTYHLSRVAHWVSNKSVAHYSTNIVRQVASPVLAEFVILHIYIISKGNDSLVNILQCASFITNAFIIWGIAKKLKCKSGYCFLASFLYMTTPIAFAESVTTQVDNFAALWMLIFVYFIIDFLDIKEKIRINKVSIINVIILGNCIAFGYLCKPSVSIAMVIFALWLLFICILRKDKIINLIKLIAYSLPGMIIPLGIEISRNIYTFKKPASPITGGRQLIGTLNPAYVLVNYIKNITYNLPNIYDDNSQSNILFFVHKIANILKVVINDPSISEDGVEFQVWPARTYGIDVAVNPVIVILAIMCTIRIIFCIKKIKLSELSTQFSIVSIICFFVFCAVLRWEPFVSRYMISYLALLCIVVCIQLQDIEYKNQRLSSAIIGVTCFCSLIDLYGLYKYNKSVCEMTNSVSREEGYFFARDPELDDYRYVAEYIRNNNYKNIGFFCSENHYEYPLIKMLEGDIEQFEHIGVNNETSKYSDPNYIPDCIFVVGQYIEESYIYNDIEYHIAYDFGEGWKYILSIDP